MQTAKQLRSLKIIKEIIKSWFARYRFYVQQCFEYKYTEKRQFLFVKEEMNELNVMSQIQISSNNIVEYQLHVKQLQNH